MKIISENTKTNHARIICVFFSFASFVGPLIASIFAFIKQWRMSFVYAGGLAVVLGIGAFLVISVMESKGFINYIKISNKSVTTILDVFKLKNIGFYIVVSCLVEIAAASINQWLTIYMTEPLGFSKDAANMIYSAIAILRSFMPFVTLAIFRAIKEKNIPITRVTFSISAIGFLLLIISPNRWLSLVILALALMSTSCTAALLWSIYIPSLGKTGRVSSVNGVIDCIGYIAAAAANLLFANVMSNVGWNTLYVLWSMIGVTGLISTFVFRTKKD